MLKLSAADRNGQSALTGLATKLVGRDPENSTIPASMRKAVRFMLGGGAMTLLVAVFWLIVAFADKNALTDSNGKKLSNGQFAGGVVQVFIVEFLIPVALWVLMARFNRAGANWARIVASVLCAIDTYLSFGLVNSLRNGQTLTVADVVYIVLTLASWVIGVIAIVLLWRSESSVYYRERSARR
ncbi:MAG TPA: hypothetical protein VN714_15965 [Trebonia sp.]|jgi:hypothetical protein|nr:hypothetical protein [Trebonia sp.]